MNKNGVTKKLCFSDDDIKKIENLAALGLTMDQIASVWDRGRKSFERYANDNPLVKQAIEIGRIKSNMAVTKAAYQMAVSGEFPAMTMFWLKCRARWKEVTHHEHSGTLTLEQLVAGGYEQAKKQHQTGSE